jgi:hypothetical protein
MIWTNDGLILSTKWTYYTNLWNGMKNKNTTDIKDFPWNVISPVKTQDDYND